jgi:hypothetical protein
VKPPINRFILAPVLAACAACEPLGGKPPVMQFNPNPVEAYPFTMRIENAPGDFKYISVAAQYDVENIKECGRVHPKTGMPSRMTRMEAIVLEAISEVEFRGTVYADRMKDQDYHGRGVCRWKFSGTSALLKATGADADTRFLYDMDFQDVLEGRSHSLYYVKKHYPVAIRPRSHEVRSFPATGAENPEEYIPALRSSLFKITMISEGRLQ